MGMYEDFRAMATAMRLMTSVEVRARVNHRSAQRIREMATAYNVTDSELCSGLLALLVDHAAHVKIIAMDTSSHAAVFSEVVVDPLIVLHDLLAKGFDVHMHCVKGPDGYTYRVWVDGTDTEIDAYGSSLGGAIRSLPSAISMDFPEQMP